MPLIEIRGLTKLYTMGDSVVRALDGVDLTIHAGEFVAITGASGSGKSTMMHLLGCLDRPTAGSYVLDGRDVSHMSDTELAAIRNSRIGFVFQTFNLINRTSALDNVGVPLFYARRANTTTPARKALEHVGLLHRASHKPSELSGGERQRVAIARAIVNEPLMLLADEPTGNLDSRTTEQIMQVFHDLNAQGVTIILVTHEPDIAMQARRVVQMRDGRIRYDGPPDHFNVRTQGDAAERAPTPAAPAIVAAQPARPANGAPDEHEQADARARATMRDNAAAAALTLARSAARWAWVSIGLDLANFVGGQVAQAYYPPPKEFRPGQPLPVASMIFGGVILISWIVSLVLGILAAWRATAAVRIAAPVGRRSEPDRAARRARWLGVLGIALPFLLAIVTSLFKSLTAASAS